MVKFGFFRFLIFQHEGPMFLELVEEMRVCAFVLHSLLEIELLVWINLNLLCCVEIL